jgi:heptosyltransferase-2
MANRILIVQLADIGDLILATPALAALREKYPDAHITLLASTHAVPVVENTNLISEILTFDKGKLDGTRALLNRENLRRILALRQAPYDVVIFLHHFTLKLGTLKFALIAWASGAQQRIGLDNGSGWFLTERVEDKGFGAKHQAQYWLDVVGLLGAQTQPRRATIGIHEEDRIWAIDSTVGAKSQAEALRIAIHPGSGGYSSARRWDVPKFAALADILQAKYHAQIILVGSENDDTAAVKAAMRTPAFDMSGRTTLGQLAALLETCDLFIGADSGVMHVAAAAGTPIVAIFGPSNQRAWGPWTPEDQSIVVRSAVECSPCSYVAHTVGLRRGCEARTCMHMLEAGEVLHAARQLLEGLETSAQPIPPKIQFDRRVRILGVNVDAITYAEWLDLIGAWVKDNRQIQARHVCTVNPEFVMIAQQDVNFYNILSRADVCIADGVGLLWAAQHLKQPLPERVTGSDGVPMIAERAAREGWKLFLLGAAEGVAERTAEILRARYPGVNIVGAYAGSPSAVEEDDLVARVNSSGADILFVAYGAPIQDKWIARNLPRLHIKMAMGVGGAFDFIAGVLPRAPLWMQRLGLEWLFRLYLQPKRIGRMMRLPRFVLAVLRRGTRAPSTMEGRYG